MKIDDAILNKLDQLEKKDIRLWSEDGKLKFKAPAGLLSDEDKAFLKEHKATIIEYFENNIIDIVIDKKNQYEPFKMTEIQQAYVLGRNKAFEYGGTACHIYMEFEYDELQKDKAQNVWNQIIQRHPMFRATMAVDGYQQILSTVPEFEIKEVKCNHQDIIETRKKIKKELDHKIYDTTQWPLHTVVLTKDENSTILHLSIEFISADWSSIWTVLGEFESLYFNPNKSLPQLDLTFRDYMMAEEKLRTGSNYYRDKSYWINRIDTLPSAPELPILPQDNDGIGRFTRNQFNIPKDKWDQFCNLSRKYGVTPTNAVMSAYGMTIARWSKNKSFCLNLSILNRLELHPQVSQIVGDFTASNLLEMHQTIGSSFQEIAKASNRQLFDDLDHRLFTGVNVLRELQQRKGSSLMPYVFTGAIGLIPIENSKLVGKMTNQGISQTPQVFMDCQAMDTIEGLNINIDTRDDIFPQGFIEDFCQTLENLLLELATNDDSWTKKPLYLPLPSEQTKIIESVNQTKTKQEKYLLHEKVMKKLQQDSLKFAVADHEVCWNRQQLKEVVYKIIGLLQDQGIGYQDVVAIALPKSRWQVAACLAILSIGATYVPLQIKSAKKRALNILEKVNAKCLISNEFIGFDSNKMITIEQIENSKIQRQIEISNQTTLDDIAYIIFTSGSTGEPKGVSMSHGGAINTIEAINTIFNISESDRVFNLSQLNFDLSVYDIFGVIGVGGGIVIVDDNQYKNPVHWVEMINKYEVTIWNSVPALMQLLLTYLEFEKQVKIHSLSTILLSGDWIPLDLPTQLQHIYPKANIVSLGGATEGGIWSNYHICNQTLQNPQQWKSIPYGKPLPNQGFMILDSHMQPCPFWVAGDLYITGESLAIEYWQNELLTQSSFMEINGIKAYKTGDVGCYHPDGNIEFIGRSDNQIKLRGHRVELGEVEVTIKKQLQVTDVRCVIHEVSNEKKLVAIIVNDQIIDEKTLESELLNWLPNYMIPTICIMSDEIALTANGKVDKNAINQLIEDNIYQNSSKEMNERDLTTTETIIKEIMMEILELENIGLNDDFYEMGANSLLLARAAGQINQKIQSSNAFDSYLVQLLNHPTIEAMSKFIDQSNESTDEDIQKLDKIELEFNQKEDNCLKVIFDSNTTTVLNDLKNQNIGSYLFVPLGYDDQQVIEFIQNKGFETIELLANDSELETCLDLASNLILQGIIPTLVHIVETNQENEVSIDSPYMGDLQFILTISSIDEKDEIISALEDFCIGEITITEAKTSTALFNIITS